MAAIQQVLLNLKYNKNPMALERYLYIHKYICVYIHRHTRREYILFYVYMFTYIYIYKEPIFKSKYTQVTMVMFFLAKGKAMLVGMKLQLSLLPCSEADSLSINREVSYPGVERQSPNCSLPIQLGFHSNYYLKCLEINVIFPVLICVACGLEAPL